MPRSIPALLMGGTLTTMALAGCAATPSATPEPATATAATPASAAATGTIQGLSADMRWGPVQVTIVVKGKRLTDVQATAPTERPRSAFINDQAVPWLRQEALQAQS